MIEGQAFSHVRMRRDQQGATAVEFALVFPVFFLVLYAVITYSLIFVTQQALSMAAAEGARAAVSFQANPDTLSARNQAAQNMVRMRLPWLDGRAGLALPTPELESCAGGLSCLRVKVTYDYANHPLVPALLGPVLSLPTPATLTGEAVAQIALNY